MITKEGSFLLLNEIIIISRFHPRKHPLAGGYLALECGPLRTTKKTLIPHSSLDPRVREYRLAGSIIIASRPFNNRLGPRHKGEAVRDSLRIN